LIRPPRNACSQDLFSTEANILPDQENRRLIVKVHRVSRPAVDQAITTLFEQLNAAEIIYPGTDLTLTYGFVGHHDLNNRVTSTSTK